jgi:hypothetical protein
VVGDEDRLPGLDLETAVRRRSHSLDDCAAHHGKVEAAGVHLEVIAHRPSRGKVIGLRWEGHPRQPVDGRRAEQPKRVPVVAPVIADPLIGIDHQEREAALRQVVGGREARLAGADDQGPRPDPPLLVHGSPLVVSEAIGRCRSPSRR